MFLAASHIFPWTPTLSVFILYLIGVVLIARSWYLLRGSRAQAFVVLAFLTLNPIFFTETNQRMERDAFICAVSTVVIGLLLVVLPHLKDDLTTFGVLVLAAIVLVAGIAVGIVAITKPTWLWLPPVCAALSLPFVTQIARRRGWRIACIRATLIVLVFCTGVIGTVEACKVMDNRRYHVALVDDSSTGQFARAWKLWASVEAGRVRPFVAITSTMRAAVYRISPTAAKLAPLLEAPNDASKQVDCRSVVHICNEAGGWFEWDLLGASSKTGRVHSVEEVQVFFSRIADDIARACSDGKLRCSTSPVLGSGLPPLDDIPLTAVMADAARGLQEMVWNRLPIGPTPSVALTPASYAVWSEVVSGMPSEHSLRKPPRSNIVYPVLRFVDVIYGFGNLALLALAAAGAGATALGILSRGSRPRRRTDSISSVPVVGALLVGPVLGMGGLGLFQAAQGLTYVTPLYWTDFATPLELALVVAGLAGWANLASRYRRNRPKSGSHEPEELLIARSLASTNRVRVSG
jgi:hypothetical protein